MADIELTNTFTDVNDANLGSKIQANFGDVTDVLNGGLDETHLDDESELGIQKMIASTQFVTPKIESPAEVVDLVIDIDAVPTGAKLKITDSADVVLFQILETGGIQIGV